MDVSSTPSGTVFETGYAVLNVRPASLMPSADGQPKALAINMAKGTALPSRMGRGKDLHVRGIPHGAL